MKFHFKYPPYVVFALLMLLVTGSVIYSCRKDLNGDGNSPASKTLDSHHVNITALQNAYADGIRAGKLRVDDISSQAMANIVGTLNVDWSSYTLQEFPDSSKIIEFAMPDDTTLIAPSDSLKSGHKKYASKTSAVFILHKDTIILNFFMKTVEDQNDPNYQSVISQLHYLSVPGGFNGEVLYFTLGRQFINGYLWQGGSITKALSLSTIITPPSPQTQSYKGKLKVDVTTLSNCVQDTYQLVSITTVTTPYGSTTTETPIGDPLVIVTCTENDTPSNGPVTGGGGLTPPPPPCTPASSGAAATSVQHGQVINTTTGGGSTSGSTKTTPPPPCPTTTPKPPATTTTTTTVKDPCQEKNTVSSRAANSTVANQNAQILAKSTTYEYGADQNLTSLTGSSYQNTSITGGTSTDAWTPSFSWDSTNGYTIGSSHGHPGGDGPSPDDVFGMIYDLTNTSSQGTQNLLKAGSSAINFYRNNVSATVVIKNGTFVVTVNNWGKLQALYTQFLNSPVNPVTNLNAFDANFQSIANTYTRNNTNASNTEGSEYALLTIFGDSINVYKAAPGSTNYTPQTLTNSKPANTICP